MTLINAQVQIIKTFRPSALTKNLAPDGNFCSRSNQSFGWIQLASQLWAMYNFTTISGSKAC